MPRHDYKCEACGYIEEVTLTREEERDGCRCHCTRCANMNPMTRLPSAPSFIIKGFNAQNGYTTK